jgi:hypothetical protein
VTSLTLPPRPPGSPPLAHAWQTLGDGLLTQRLHLHLGEWRTAVAEEKALPDVPGADVSVLAQRPSPLPAGGESAMAVLEDAGLGFWWELPQRHGAESRNQHGALHRAADTAAQNILAEQSGAAWSDAVTAASAASAAAAWWVGFFAVIRHRGVHHITLEPHPGPLHEQALGTAVSVVANGMATRVLEAALRHSDDDPALRAAYCRAIEAGICAEPELPRLIDELAELRLVDLVSTTARWRGRFTKYAGGTGAGQVE